MDLMQKDSRIRIISEIKGPENQGRKALSLRQYEIFQDRQNQYVIEYLREQFSAQSVRQMPVISSINIARRVVKQEASLYRTSPKRTFHGMASDDQADMLQSIYSESGWNDKFLSSNEYFKLQQQSHLMWVLKDGYLKPRVLLPHHLDVIPDPEDPEKGMIYIISSFDKEQFLQKENKETPTGYIGKSTFRGLNSDFYNQKIGDPEDYQSLKERYVVWSKDFNFIMNGAGDIVSEETENPLGGVIPIVEISTMKDFEYWVRVGQSVTDFSIQFNGMISDIANVVRMQGHGQAVFTGPEGVIPESLQLGPNTVIRLPTDPNNPNSTSDFKFVTANADIQGSLEFLKANLSMFLSTRGIDPKSINAQGTSESFASGVERLLSMIEKFEASRSDMDAFKKAEMQSFEIVKAYLNTYAGSDLLDEKMQIGIIPEDAYMTIDFNEPQMIKSEKEVLDLVQQKREMGLLSRVKAYMELHQVDEATAMKEIAEIDGEGMIGTPTPPPRVAPPQEDIEDSSEED